jgi:hypothetical protein
MTLDQIIKHFGTRKNAGRMLDINPGTITNWIRRKNGEVPRYWHAHIIREAAKHGLIIDEIT